MGFFGFFSMMDDYDTRNVDNYSDGFMTIDTSAATDTDRPFETGIQHPQFNDGKWVIVEYYDTREDAQVGHNKWVYKMTHELPDMLVDVSTCEIALLIDAIGSTDNHGREAQGYIEGSDLQVVLRDVRSASRSHRSAIG